MQIASFEKKNNTESVKNTFMVYKFLKFVMVYRKLLILEMQMYFKLYMFSQWFANLKDLFISPFSKHWFEARYTLTGESAGKPHITRP